MSRSHEYNMQTERRSGIKKAAMELNNDQTRSGLWRLIQSQQILYLILGSELIFYLVKTTDLSVVPG